MPSANVPTLGKKIMSELLIREGLLNTETFVDIFSKHRTTLGIAEGKFTNLIIDYIVNWLRKKNLQATWENHRDAILIHH